MRERERNVYKELKYSKVSLNLQLSRYGGLRFVIRYKIGMVMTLLKNILQKFPQ